MLKTREDYIEAMAVLLTKQGKQKWAGKLLAEFAEERQCLELRIQISTEEIIAHAARMQLEDVVDQKLYRIKALIMHEFKKKGF